MLFSLIVCLLVAVVLIQVGRVQYDDFSYIAQRRIGRSRCHSAVSWMFRLALWLTTGIATKEWVAVHRKHHAFTDEEGDPHSPALMGFWSVQLGNVFHYVREARNPEVVARYARDIEDDIWDRMFFNHGTAGLVVGVVSLCALMGIGWGLLAAGIHAVTYIFVLSSSINGLCHAVGYKNFDNTATNLRFLALLTGGEGLPQQSPRIPAEPKVQFQG